MSYPSPPPATLEEAEAEVAALSRAWEALGELLAAAVARRNQLRAVERRQAERDLRLARRFLGSEVQFSTSQRRS